MPLVLVGLGLADERDVTVKGLDAIRAAARVYLEAYTSVLLVPKERLVRRLPFVALDPCSILARAQSALDPRPRCRRPTTEGR